MKEILTLVMIAIFIASACSKDENDEVNYPMELVPYSEFKNMLLNVGGLEKSTTGLVPGSFLSEEDLSKDIAYIKFSSDKMLSINFKGTGTEYKVNATYNFKADSLIAEPEGLDNESIYLGRGDRKSLKKECGAFLFYGYQIKNGNKVDVNQDNVVNSNDKIRVTGLINKFVTKQDVLDKIGYGTTIVMETTDSVLVYNYTLRFVKDKNGDFTYTEADN